MANHLHHKIVKCSICHRDKKLTECRMMDTIRPSVAELVLAEHPKLKALDYICKNDLAKFRQKHIEQVLLSEKGELTKLDHEVIKSLVHHETLTRNINSQFERKLTFGERLADLVASFGGSWKFIILFAIVLALWIGLNTTQLLFRTFDPYPYILLNLCLSCLAAIQAPVIMMSQNRKEAKDRLRAEHDYKVNLKAELQIRQLHEKIDYLAQQQWQRLLELQEMEIDLLEDRKRRR